MARFIEVTIETFEKDKYRKMLFNIDCIENVTANGGGARLSLKDEYYYTVEPYEEVKEKIENETYAIDETLETIANILLSGDMKTQAQIYR